MTTINFCRDCFWLAGTCYSCAYARLPEERESVSVDDGVRDYEEARWAPELDRDE